MPTLPNTLINGTTADASEVMADLNAINAAVDQATVTSLPGSPYDGQEIYYLADATNGVVWHLKYRSGSGSAYKWEYVGGAPLVSQVDTQETTTSVTYAALTTAGPSVTVPLAGDYDVVIGVEALNSTNGAAARMSYSIGATGAVDADKVQITNAAGVASIETVLFRHRRKTGLSASTALVSKYDVSGGTGVFLNRAMQVTPVRCG